MPAEQELLFAQTREDGIPHSSHEQTRYKYSFGEYSRSRMVQVHGAQQLFQHTKEVILFLANPSFYLPG